LPRHSRRPERSLRSPLRLTADRGAKTAPGLWLAQTLSRQILSRNRANAFRIVGQYRSAIAGYRKALSLKIDEPTKKLIETALKELGVAS
jgi:hypothetical protein